MDEIVQQEHSLESWVEKYLPLKVHHNLTELLEEFMPEDKKDRFKIVARLMAASLRKSIIDDQGFSQLKKKALDLIS